jgi:tol-pal system protein YbgF
MNFNPDKKRKPKAWIIPGLLVLGAATAGIFYPAYADDVSARLNRMENEIQTLSRTVFRGDAPPPGSFAPSEDAAGTELRIQQMETQIRGLTGKIEEQGYQLDQIKAQIDRITADNMNAATMAPAAGTPQNIGQNIGQNNLQGSVVSPAYDPSYQPPQPHENGGYQWNSQNSVPDTSTASLGAMNASGAPDNASQAYEAAFALLKNGDYAGAEKGFQNFMASYPGHPLSGNAEYWLGESYYARGDFAKATRIFAESYKKDSKGPKAADNLLKLGMSLAGMGKKNDACVALKQIEKEFANVAGPVLNRAQEEMTRAGC